MAEIRGTLGPEGRRRLAAAERPLDEEVRWLARPDAPPPGTILAEFRRRFRPLLPPLRRAVDGPGVDAARRRVALTVLFGQMEGVLFRSAGDPDRITAAAADAGLAMDAADAVVLATECLSALVAAGESPA